MACLTCTPDNPQDGTPSPRVVHQRRLSPTVDSSLSCGKGRLKAASPGTPCPVEPRIKATRLGVQRQPAALVIEYITTSANEEQCRKLRLHRIWIDSTRLNDHTCKELRRALYGHPVHGKYVESVQKECLVKLLKRAQDIFSNMPNPESASSSSAPAVASTASPTSWKSPIPETTPAPTMWWTPADITTPKDEPRCSPTFVSASPLFSPTPLRNSAASLSMTGRPICTLSPVETGHRIAPGNALEQSPLATDKSPAVEERHCSPDVTERNCGPLFERVASTPEVAHQEVEEDLPGVWPSAAWLEWSRRQSRSQQSVAQLYEAFRTSRGTEGIATSFARLLVACGAQSGQTPLDKLRGALGNTRRFTELYKRLDARRTLPEYEEQPLRHQRAIIVGAGPVGLRCALELRLLGAEVIVLEKRMEFERINRLHLWHWCGKDLKGWGAKILEPPELSFGADADYMHIGIGELQMLLLKPCLLLGVQVFFGAEFVDSMPYCCTRTTKPTSVWDVSVGTQSWQSAHKNGHHEKLPRAPQRIRGVTALILADGPSGKVAKSQGFEITAHGGLRQEAAIGLVANYPNRQCLAEKGRRCFSFARQFMEEKFRECEEKTGMSLENIVCYIAAQTYYFVMTPTRRSLVECGIVSGSASDGDLLSTLDQAALARTARSVAAFPWKPEEKPLTEETLDNPVGPAVLFDFSKPRRAATGIRVREGPSINGCKPARMIVGLCGDRLLEPFWPEGLGIIRGFFGALDLSFAIKMFAETGDADLAVSRHEACFRCLKSLAAKTRLQVLKDDEEAYSLDPATRYRGLSKAEEAY